MEYRILGPLAVIAEDGDRQIGGPKVRSVLGLLLVHANQVVSNDALIDALWGDTPPASVATTLQTYVYQLRKRLSESTIRTHPTGYSLEVPRADVDALRFEDTVSAVTTDAGGDPRGVATLLAEALRSWRGAALADFDGAEWARAQATRLELLRLDATERLLDARLALGEHAAIAPELEGLVSRNPLREHFYAQLMVALYRSDRQADALRVYARLRNALRDELGLEPSRELVELEFAILSQAPALDLPAATGVAEHPPGAEPPTRSRAGPRAAVALGIAAAVATSVFVAVALSARGPRSAASEPSGYRPRYRAAACPPEPSAFDPQTDTSERCGVLTVPESRARPRGRTIDLDVLRYPSRASHPAADPVVQVGAELIGTEEPSDTLLRMRADSIYLAGRGFYGSRPRLTCPEMSAEVNASLGRSTRDPRNTSQLVQAVTECRARWTAAGVDVGAYSVAERAADVRDLAFALHLSRINLLAARTMTIEAREIAGRYPDLVRSISLFDVVPPEGNQWNGAITNAADALDRFVGECSNERACAAAYPDLRQQILETHRRNQATPETFIEDNPWGPNPPRVEVLLDGDRTLQLVLRALGNGAMGLVPAAIATRDSRTAAGFASYTLVSPEQASWGALLSRDCMTTVGRVSAEALSIEAKVSPHLAFLADDPILSLCAAWKTRPARTRAPGPVGTPTLIVVGALDPFTSLGWAEQTATSFGHATVVELPHTASADSSPAPCIGRVRSAFLADPRRPIRADACAREIPPVRFAGA